MEACRQPGRNALVGKGALGDESLLEFTRAKFQLWCAEQIRLGRLAEDFDTVVDAALYRGELTRADVAALVETGERLSHR